LLDGLSWLPLVFLLIDRVSLLLIWLSLFGIKVMRRDILVGAGFKLLMPSLFGILLHLRGLKVDRLISKGGCF